MLARELADDEVYPDEVEPSCGKTNPNKNYEKCQKGNELIS